MNAQAKPTPGPWDVVPQSDGSAMVAHEFETGQQMHPKGLRLVCHVFARRDSLAMDEANAALIAEAGTVAHETGLTPRQLAEQRKELLCAIKLCLRYGNLPREASDELTATIANVESQP